MPNDKNDFTVEPVKQNPIDHSADTGDKNTPPQIPLAGVPAIPRDTQPVPEPIPGVTVTDENGKQQFIPLPGIPVVNPKFRDNMVKPKKPPAR
ncbi:MAG: hypothetical protein HPY53_12910 [Brevinematales bacterium]|nr:hypothetical protein [Brevinematales bacterium]